MQNSKGNFKPEAGAFYQTDEVEQNIILRKTHFSDGAEPSGNAIHCENLIRLYHITLDLDYLDQAEDILRAVKQFVENYPPGYCYHVMNINYYFDSHAPTLVVALNEKGESKQEILDAIYSNFIPHKSVVWRHVNDDKLLNRLPYLQQQGPIQDQTTLYICHKGVCLSPLTDKKEMLEAIQRL